MGLHSPFGYVGYVIECGRTMVHLIDTFCGGCHTNDDYDGGCKGCPVGQLFNQCREYVLDSSTYTNQARRGKSFQEQDRIYGVIRNQAKKLRVRPGMKSRLVWDLRQRKDGTQSFVANLNWLEHLETVQLHPFIVEQARERVLNAMLNARDPRDQIQLQEEYFKKREEEGNDKVWTLFESEGDE